MKAVQRLFAAAVLSAVCSAGAAPSADGLYATLQTTMGNVCFELYYTNVPRTVANFVSLAEGSRPWIDPRNGFVSNKPYYNGILFHRVINGFMIQAGSPKGDGTDGPGYYFSDEFDQSLRHDRAGVVSMANSGPNSNGSQFFITVAAYTNLNDKYSVFGRVVEGMNIVSNIAAVATTNDKPLADITITNVFITRNGTAASTFDPARVVPGLPVVSPAVSRIYKNNGNWILDWDEHNNCAYWIYGAMDLSSGWGDLVGDHVGWDSADATGLFQNYSRFFFNVTEVLYDE